MEAKLRETGGFCMPNGHCTPAAPLLPAMWYNGVREGSGLLEFETKAREEGAIHVAGVDEVGRGCLFGDVVAAAVILPDGAIHEDIRDSKQLAEKKREMLYGWITEHAVAWSTARVGPDVIDRINIKHAARLAMKMAVEALAVQPDRLLIDAETVDSAIPQTPIIKGDQRSLSIAAASIVAKVTRDELCREWDRMYPEYGIAIHKGYATRAHREAIERFGPSPLHRRSFLGNVLNRQMELF